MPPLKVGESEDIALLMIKNLSSNSNHKITE